MKDQIELYVSSGFSVIPLQYKSKKPLLESWKKYQTRKPTPTELDQWFATGQARNVAIVTGSNSGIVVLDLDGEEGLAFLDQIGGPPQTPTVTTDRGKHLYFKHPGFRVASRELFPGVEIKGEGGLVTAPPSVHPSGKPYEWQIALQEAPIAEIPDWLREFLAPQESPPLQPLHQTFRDQDDFLSEIKRLQSALEFVSADEREVWIIVGMAMHDFFGGSYEGLAFWNEWSSKFPKKHDERELRRQWESFSSEKTRLITIASVYRLARENGWNEYDAPEFDIAIPSSRDANAGKLTEATMDRLAKRFQHFPHRPSEAQWKALRDLTANLEAMADGTAEPLYSLSSLDPGVGKTQTIAQFMKILQASDQHKDTGVIVFVGRRQEIKSFIKEMELKENEYAVRVSDKDQEGRALNALGNPISDRARLLFTTQQMLETCTKRDGKTFGNIRDFHFLGKPRVVKMWDETCLPARPVTINADQIGRMEAIAKKAGALKLVDTLNTLILEIRNHETGSFIDVPDLYAETDCDVDELDAIYKNSDEIRQIAFDLWLLSGKTVSVVREAGNKTFVHYDNTLPDDLKPMVITDASGRVRQTYHHWSEGRGDLFRLTHANKDYSNLTVHVWERASSKSAWTTGSTELISGIVSAIESKDISERWLIVHSKTFHYFEKKRGQWAELDVPEMLRQRVRNPERLSFVFWGGDEFRATNQYRDIRNVMVAGTHFLPEAAYHGLARLSLGLPSDQTVSKEALRRIKHGEHAHYLLQAVCRAYVRQSNESGCGQCEAYIIASRLSGIPTMLRDQSIFPGAKVMDWSPIEKRVKVTSKVGKAIEYVEREFARENVRTWPAPLVMKAVGVSDASNWHKDVIQHKDFQAALERLGIEYDPQKGRKGGQFRRRSGRTTAPVEDLPY